MTTLSAPRFTLSTGAKFSLLALGESALRLILVAALPISATIFVIQSF